MRRGITMMQLPIHPMIFILLFWCKISSTVAVLVSSSSSSSSELVAAPLIAKPNCSSYCGDVSIPYPFGIGPNKDCYLEEWFQIDCDNSTSGGLKPFLRRAGNLEVLSISIEGTLQVNSPVTFFSCEGKETHRQPPNLTGSPFLYSQTNNTFTAVSCGHPATLTTDVNVFHGCNSTCDVQTTNGSGSCDLGINCCQSAIPSHLSAFTTEIQQSDQMGGCKYAFLVEQEWFVNNISSDFTAIQSQGMDNVPVLLEWSISLHSNSTSLLKSFERFNLSVDSSDRNWNDSSPYCDIQNAKTSSISVQCLCPWGYQGNPYLLKPCQDNDECKGDNSCEHAGRTWAEFGGSAICENSDGGYKCNSEITGYTCDVFKYGDESFSCRYMPARPNRIKMILLGLGTSVGLLLLLIGAWWVYKVVKKKKDIKRKQMFFKRNGGLLLEQQLSSGEINIEKIKLFKSKELEMSTDNFHIDRILGQGGQGTVYKGMLVDGRIVAVKKSKIVDESNLSEFINEVVILSQINHRNVVQLLGCCLETEVPLLVYEFIPNGTLDQYIQGQIEDFPLTWEMRLRIAAEIAGALSYLHSAASFPIYHRDIKSTNILLDEKYRAKVADFGTSRSIVIGQTHLTTIVHGTFGYLDPEYFQSSQFTEKSDVYSFGVVLVELLTGQKPISFIRSEQEGRSLATYFIISMQEDRLFEVVDDQVAQEGSKADISVVANLARRCLDLNGRKRPTMREVTAELEGIQMSEKASNVEVQNYEEAEFVRTESIEPWNVVSSSAVTGSSVFDSGSAPSFHEIPLLSFKSL